MKRYQLSIVGAGRVASVLGPALLNAGHNIVSVHSRGSGRGRDLALRLSALYRDSLDIPSHTEIVLIMASDDSIESIAKGLQCSDNTIVAHTAGSIGMSSLVNDFRRGVFYPLQTFTTGRDLPIDSIPFFIEGDSTETAEILSGLAASITNRVIPADSEQRRMLHVAAVFASNFTNNMLHNSQIILNRSEIPFDVLKPLVEETVMKAFDIGPELAQTGPAVRNDTQTMSMQKDLLSFDQQLNEIYDSISRLIITYKKNKERK